MKMVANGASIEISDLYIIFFHSYVKKYQHFDVVFFRYFLRNECVEVSIRL